MHWQFTAQHLSRKLLAHWGVEDPAAIEGSDEEKMAAFNLKVTHMLQNRIKLFTAIPIANLDSMIIKHEIEAIGKIHNQSAN